MTPLPKNITIRIGNTKEIFFRIRTRVWDSVTNKWVPGPYRDLTGWTVLCQVRKNADDPTVLMSFTYSLGDQTDVTNGRGSVYLKASPTETVKVPRAQTKGVFDIKLTTPGGDVYTYIEGEVAFKKDVSRVATGG